MGNNFQLLDIILFAAIAGFLLFRLRNVLGRRTGNERQRPNPFAQGPAEQPRSDISRADDNRPEAAPTPPSADTNAAAQRWGQPQPIPDQEGLAAIQAADPGFDADAFLSGARAAFEIIVKAFAAGDDAALKSLLSPDVFAAFSEAIRARRAAKEVHETKLVAIKSASIEHGAIEGARALIAVKLTSDQINVTRDASGKAVEGDPDHAVEKIDIWTFSRPLRSRDPNWVLVATHS